MQKKQLSVLVLIILCFLLGCNRETPKDESQQNYEDESNISKTNGEELVNINSELLGSTPFDIQIDKTALQTRKETETEVTIKTNLTDWGYTVSSEKGKISDINKNSFIYIAPKDERDDTIKIQLSDYENGISYEYTIPLIFAGNNEHSLDKFKENLCNYEPCCCSCHCNRYADHMDPLQKARCFHVPERFSCRSCCNHRRLRHRISYICSNHRYCSWFRCCIWY